MIFMWLVPLGFLALLILGVVWLVKAVAQPGAQTFATVGRACPNCGRPAQADWQVCPYCGQSLTRPGGVQADTV
jgi:predicted amidophosphoribosyltransferase